MVKTKKSKKWKNRFYVDIYRLSLQGLSDYEIAKTLGVSQPTYTKWKNEKPTVKYAIEAAKDKSATVGSYMDFVYDRLPDELKELWEKIQDVEDEPNAIKRMERILEQGGKYARMQLFLYALVQHNFNPSRALSSVNMKLKELKSWMYTEPGFAEIMEEMKEHKKNFAEEALFKLVGKGDANAIIFVNKTLNKDRGYVDKQTIEHVGEIKHSHSHRLLDLSKLDLSFECRKEIMDAYKKLVGEKPLTLDYKVNGNKAVPADTPEDEEE